MNKDLLIPPPFTRRKFSKSLKWMFYFIHYFMKEIKSLISIWKENLIPPFQTWCKQNKTKNGFLWNSYKIKILVNWCIYSSVRQTTRIHTFTRWSSRRRIPWGTTISSGGSTNLRPCRALRSTGLRPPWTSSTRWEGLGGRSWSWSSLPLRHCSAKQKKLKRVSSR